MWINTQVWVVEAFRGSAIHCQTPCCDWFLGWIDKSLSSVPTNDLTMPHHTHGLTFQVNRSQNKTESHESEKETIICVGMHGLLDGEGRWAIV